MPGQPRPEYRRRSQFRHDNPTRRRPTPPLRVTPKNALKHKVPVEDIVILDEPTS